MATFHVEEQHSTAQKTVDTAPASLQLGISLGQTVLEWKTMYDQGFSDIQQCRDLYGRSHVTPFQERNLFQIHDVRRRFHEAFCMKLHCAHLRRPLGLVTVRKWHQEFTEVEQTEGHQALTQTRTSCPRFLHCIRTVLKMCQIGKDISVDTESQQIGKISYNLETQSRQNSHSNLRIRPKMEIHCIMVVTADRNERSRLTAPNAASKAQPIGGSGQ